MLEIAHTESHGHGIETLAAEAHLQAVALLEGDLLLKSLIGHLLACHLQHTVAQVDALHGAVQVVGKVASAGSHVEQTLGGYGSHFLARHLAPPLVDAKRHGTVHEVVGWGNGVEHGLHLLGLAVGFAIGLYLFYFIHVFF